MNTLEELTYQVVPACIRYFRAIGIESHRNQTRDFEHAVKRMYCYSFPHIKCPIHGARSETRCSECS